MLVVGVVVVAVVVLAELDGVVVFVGVVGLVAVVAVGGAVLGSVVVVELDVVEWVFVRLLDEPPKKVVGWPLPVIERPATRSGTV